MSKYVVKDEYDDAILAQQMSELAVNNGGLPALSPPAGEYEDLVSHPYHPYEGGQYDDPNLPYDDEDERNMEEIDQMLGFSGNDNYDDEIDDVDDLDIEEQAKAYGVAPSPKPKSPGAYLPAGAVPSQGGKLSAHAAEFWFPESRNCPCCAGFKHGCKCIDARAGVDTCVFAECINTAFVNQVNSTLAASESSASASARTERKPLNIRPKQSPGAVLPAGAVPSQGGKLSAHAAEFWFPECRNCPCCNGFKHGCNCVKQRGVDTCVDANCVNAEFVSQVTNTLAAGSGRYSQQSPSAYAPSSASASVSGGRSPSGYPSSGRGGGGGGDVCRFFLSGNCRFGAACRNRHPQT